MEKFFHLCARGRLRFNAEPLRLWMCVSLEYRNDKKQNFSVNLLLKIRNLENVALRVTSNLLDSLYFVRFVDCTRSVVLFRRK